MEIKKTTLIMSCFIIVILASTIVFALSSEERRQLSECRSGCSKAKNTENKECKSDYKECKTICKVDYKSCIENAQDERTLCRVSCNLIEDRQEKRQCTRECSITYSQARRTECNRSECNSVCKEERNNCKDTVKETFSECKLSCEAALTEAKEVIDYVVPEEECISSGGLYQQLCKGHYFRLMCSRESYCQCAGFAEYTCPASYECILDHNIKVRGRSHFTEWHDMLGRDLGLIGLCGKIIESNSTAE